LDEGTGVQAGDFSGFKNNGTLATNGGSIPSWTNAGKRGDALKFDGSTNYVTMGNIASMNGMGSTTVSAWVKASSPGVNPAQSVILSKSACSGGAQDGPFELTLSVSGKTAKFVVYNSALNTSSGPSATNVDDGKWHLVTGEYDGVKASIWVDGVQENSSGAFGILHSTSTLFTIGGACSPGNPVNQTGYYSGTIDDVRVYNRALSASDVANLYDQGTAGATQIGASSAFLTNNTTLGPANGLVGHWTFDGADTQSTIADKSGQGNNGYWNGSATSSAKVQGHLGQALKFNGTTNYVDTANFADNLPNFTASAWFKTATSCDQQLGCGASIISKLSSGGIGAGNGWILALGGGCGFTQNGVGAFIQSDGGTNYHAVTSTGTYNDGKWHLATMGVTGAETIALYVDGSLVSSTSCCGTVNSYSCCERAHRRRRKRWKQ
jgi:hypothetical protein